MKITLGFSPCPNDTFIFDALVHNKIDTEGLQVEPVLEDIETLNRWAAEGRLDATKLSFPAFFQHLSQYIALPSGAALGQGVGPLLVAGAPLAAEEVAGAPIAIPGENTTANFLLSFAFPGARNRFPVLFSEIEDTVLSQKARLGLLIHENRFTYAQRGLVKIMDLGEYWEQQTGLPIPLACIAVKRGLDGTVQQQLGRLIRKSLEYAFAHYPALPPFVEQHAQAMDKEVMRKHIDLYVNNYSLDLGAEGRQAIQNLYGIYRDGRQQEGAVAGAEDLFL
ncbi:1,4-dihydroxy-6-naphthoate synthase [Paraflavisolibacter sp. H34]|uniref:1,4-dihydroxy-6-naphthoate synthase n=1 Tax=Huijunlia imazamoxiresistens TaxID=3127457 RepID=UPI003017EFA8